MKNVSFEQFSKEINKLRRGAKNGALYGGTWIVDGKQVSISAHDTWLKVFKVDGVQHAGAMAQSVKQFNEELAKAL